MKRRVLVVEHDDNFRSLAKSRLEREGHDVLAVRTLEEAQKQIEQSSEFAVVITELRVGGRDGIDFVNWVKARSPLSRVVVVAAHSDKDAVAKAMRAGVSSFLDKPVELEELHRTIKSLEREYQIARDESDRYANLAGRVDRLEGKEEDQFWFVSKSRAMSKINEWLTILRREAMRGDSEEPKALILGPQGAGKKSVARMIHLGSRKAKGPWVTVDCTVGNSQEVEAEIFGCEKDALPGVHQTKRGALEVAKDGSIYLSEIGALDTKIQQKLAQAFQSGSFKRVGGNAEITLNCRVIASSSQDLAAKIANGSFREDLHGAFQRAILEVPALKDRAEDIIPMAQEFATKAYRKRGKTFTEISADAQQILSSYNWPGHVEELWSVLERAALLSDGTGVLAAKNIQLSGAYASSQLGGGGPRIESVASPFGEPNANGLNGYMDLKKKWLDSFEREYLAGALARHGGNVSAAAREARLDRSNFLRLLRRHAIRAQEFRKAA